MGEGSYRKIAEVIAKLACQRIFIALDAALLKTEFYAGIAILLRDAKVSAALFTAIEPDPSALTVEKAFAVCQAHQATVRGSATSNFSGAKAVPLCEPSQNGCAFDARQLHQ